MVWSVVAVQPNSDVRDQMYCADFCWHTTDCSTTKHNDDDDDDDDDGICWVGLRKTIKNLSQKRWYHC